MNKYKVLIVGTAYMEGEGNTPEEAREYAIKNAQDQRFGIWDMNLEFICEEADLVTEAV